MLINEVYLISGTIRKAGAGAESANEHLRNKSPLFGHSTLIAEPGKCLPGQNFSCRTLR